MNSSLEPLFVIDFKVYCWDLIIVSYVLVFKIVLNLYKHFVWVLRCFSCVQFIVTPWTVAVQAPLCMGLSLQEYWSGLPVSLLGVLLNLGIKTHGSYIGRRIFFFFFYHWDTWEAGIYSFNQLVQSLSLSNSLEPYGLKYARLPCPSPIPGACLNSCPSSQWHYPTISSPSPSAFHLSQHQGLFQWVSSLHQMAKVFELQFQHQFFQWYKVAVIIFYTNTNTDLLFHCV